MQDYNHKEVEKRIYEMWEKGGYFTPKIDPNKKPFSIFLPPPNASGAMHVGNALVIGIQDILARYHRAKGDSTLWIPGTDHGGYETQVTFERELEKKGMNRLDFAKSDLYDQVEHYVEGNNELIQSQIRAMGASVDWSRFRYTMDEQSLHTVDSTFRKMVADNLIYRRNYMVNYCASCATVLADIELKENKEKTPLYFIKFAVEGSDEYVSLATARPEFLFATTHVIIHPADARFAQHIGKKLRNPTTGDIVEVVADTRKFDPENLEPFLRPFSPAYKSYDYGYTLRSSIPVRNVVNWNGNMIERYPGLKPVEARNKEIAFLNEHGAIEKFDDTHEDSVYLCKRGHTVESIITLTWFLKIDDEKKSLRKAAISAMKKQGLVVVPRWKEKGLMTWMEKMIDWPIARQNVWGIRIPFWYEITDPSQFLVWFIDPQGAKQFGNLKNFLDKGISLDEIIRGLERVYANEGAHWVLDKEAGKSYLPETDTFDTWFSSGQWSTMAFGDVDSPDFHYFYPSESIITGHDLLRLFISRCLLMSQYVTDKLPFKIVYLHRLIQGADGQKMSKSLGNAVSLEEYLEKCGADVTRMGLVSYSSLPDDFIFEESRLRHFQDFSTKLLSTAEVISVANEYIKTDSKPAQLSVEDEKLLDGINRLAKHVGSDIEKYSLSEAQEKVCGFLASLTEFAHVMNTQSDPLTSLAVFRRVFGKYLTILHPFMPFMTEEIYTKYYGQKMPLAASTWPV